MTKTKSKPSRRHAPICVIIHGHYYQPPRENPWTGWIDRQESAFPYANWNERINVECYTANCYSRILNPAGHIEDIHNNFNSTSYDFGPTLMNWLEEYHPETHAKVVDADQRSVERFDGHGNALAHPYHHTILPLADGRDSATEILWGLADFKHRYGRRPEGMWLPETAINAQVVDMLIDHGIRFTVLAPTQAERVRPLSRKGVARHPWIDVSDSSIDPRMPYRVFATDAEGMKDKTRYLDIFFYDGQLARGVAFDGLLKSADQFADQLFGSADPSRRAPQLIHVGTDGESYGHHEPFGDMCLAALLNKKLEARGLQLTNYGQFLSIFPPQWEVEIKEGERGEGTAWSCSHGLGRWKRDCGCNGGAPPGWNQEWRRPLRHGLDHLRNELRRVYTRVTADILRDPWLARDEYIEVLCAGGTAEGRAKFLKRHLLRGVDPSEVSLTVFELLESQRCALAMYTSCGWFFNDISGIEGVQNLKYAARAIDLATPYSGIDLSEILLCHLRFAKSNVAQHQDGAKVYESLALPARITPRQAVFNLLLEEACLHRDGQRFVRSQRFEGLEADPVLSGLSVAIAGSCGPFSRVDAGVVNLVTPATGKTLPYRFFLLSASEGIDFLAWIVEGGTPLAPKKAQKLAKVLTKAAGMAQVQEAIQESYGEDPLGLGDARPDLREAVARAHLLSVRHQVGDRVSSILSDFRPLLGSLTRMGIKLDEQWAKLAEMSLNHAIDLCVERARAGDQGLDVAAVKELNATAASLGVTINPLPLRDYVLEDLIEELGALRREIEAESLEAVKKRNLRIKEILDLDTDLAIKAVRQTPENMIDDLLEREVARLAEGLEDLEKDLPRYRIVREVLDLAAWFNFDTAGRRLMVDNYERRLANRPEMWP